jgi:filamentous hemagglutinin
LPSAKELQNFAPSQIGTDPVAPLLAFGGMPLAYAGSNLVTGTFNITSGKLEGGGDINVVGSNVSITEARETSSGQTTSFFEQSGISVSVNVPILGMAQNAASLAQAARNTSNGRVSALGAAATGLTGYNTANQIASAGGSPASLLVPSVTVGIGSSTSSSASKTASNTSAGSSLQAAGNVNIQATGNASSGAGNILIQGSNVNANNNVSLSATRDILLQAASNTQSENSTSSSSSSGASVTMSMAGTVTGAGVSSSSSSGNSNGQSTSYTNTNVGAGNTLAINSGGNTSLIGAVASGNTTNVVVGGNLVIQSLQDTSTYNQAGQSSGVSLGVIISQAPITTLVGQGTVTSTAAGGSISTGRTNIDNSFNSVNQTSGIQAGAGGFNVQVGGNTTLIGGQITSSSNATTGGANGTSLNSFKTNGTITTIDLNNSAAYQGSGYSVTVGTGNSAGYGQANGQASSTTQSGITGVAGNANLTTGGAGTNTGIAPIFNAAAVNSNINAQIYITKTALPQITTNMAAMMSQKQADLLKQANDAKAAGNDELAKQLTLESDKYGEGGAYRLLAHTVLGALGGGAGGAAGALTSQTLVPVLGEALKDLDLPQSLKNAIVLTAGAVIGGATGGTAGAVTGGSATANNYLTSKQWIDLAAELKASKTQAERDVVNKKYADISAKQDLALANCDKTNNCAQLKAEVANGTAVMTTLIGDGSISNALAGLQTPGQRLAVGSAAYRAQQASIMQIPVGTATPLSYVAVCGMGGAGFMTAGGCVTGDGKRYGQFGVTTAVQPNAGASILFTFPNTADNFLNGTSYSGQVGVIGGGVSPGNGFAVDTKDLSKNTFAFIIGTPSPPTLSATCGAADHAGFLDCASNANNGVSSLIKRSK